MNKNEVRIAPIFRYGRKINAMSQVDLSDALGVRQSTVSKIEAGKSMPTLDIVVRFCELTKISPNWFLIGHLEIEPTENWDTDQRKVFKNEKSFMEEGGTKIRSFAPILGYMQEKLGYEGYEKFLKDMGLDPDYLINWDSEVHMSAFLEIIQKLRTRELANFTEISAFFNDKKTHGLLAKEYLDSKSVESVIKTYIQNQKKYQRNFSLYVEKEENMTNVQLHLKSSYKETVSSYVESIGDIFNLYVEAWLGGLVNSFLKGIKLQTKTPIIDKDAAFKGEYLLC